MSAENMSKPETLREAVTALINIASRLARLRPDDHETIPDHIDEAIRTLEMDVRGEAERLRAALERETTAMDGLPTPEGALHPEGPDGHAHPADYDTDGVCRFCGLTKTTGESNARKVAPNPSVWLDLLGAAKRMVEDMERDWERLAAGGGKSGHVSKWHATQLLTKAIHAAEAATSAPHAGLRDAARGVLRAYDGESRFSDGETIAALRVAVAGAAEAVASRTDLSVAAQVLLDRLFIARNDEDGPDHWQRVMEAEDVLHKAIRVAEAAPVPAKKWDVAMQQIHMETRNALVDMLVRFADFKAPDDRDDIGDNDLLAAAKVACGAPAKGEGPALSLRWDGDDLRLGQVWLGSAFPSTMDGCEGEWSARYSVRQPTSHDTEQEARAAVEKRARELIGVTALVETPAADPTPSINCGACGKVIQVDFPWCGCDEEIIADILRKERARIRPLLDAAKEIAEQTMEWPHEHVDNGEHSVSCDSDSLDWQRKRRAIQPDECLCGAMKIRRAAKVAYAQIAAELAGTPSTPTPTSLPPTDAYWQKWIDEGYCLTDHGWEKSTKDAVRGLDEQAIRKDERERYALPSDPRWTWTEQAARQPLTEARAREVFLALFGEVAAKHDALLGTHNTATPWNSARIRVVLRALDTKEGK